MKKNKFIYILSALVLAGATSCEDTLTEKPDSYYEKENYFVNETNANMAIVGIYDCLAKLQHYGQNEMAIPSSDDTYYIQGTGTDNTRRDISHYTLSPSNTWITTCWTWKYKGIDRANYAIDGIESMEGYADSKRLKSYAAEARFLRALFSLDLVKYWGDVPYKTMYSASYEDAYQPRMDREKIYDQIIEDLNFAKDNMDWATASSTPERATQGAARALLMRAYLQRAGYSLQMNGKMTRPDDEARKKYFEAVTKEWEAFVANGYHDFYADGYAELFKGFSAGKLDTKESLFEIAFFNVSGDNEDSGIWGTYNGPKVEAPGAGADMSQVMGRANAFFRVVPEWKGFFEDNDARRDIMVCTYQYKWDKATLNHKKAEQKSGKNWYPGKWRREWMPLGFKNPNNTDVNYCFLRYADVVLMAAEAYNELNDPATAWSLINKVRARSGATQIDGTNYADFYKAPKVYDLEELDDAGTPTGSLFIDDSTPQGQVRTALYWERGFELAFEGQRKYDLIRWNVLFPALKLFGQKTIADINPKTAKDLYPAYKNFKPGKHELLPIPQDEMDINSKLTEQNPGY